MYTLCEQNTTATSYFLFQNKIVSTMIPAIQVLHTVSIVLQQTLHYPSCSVIIYIGSVIATPMLQKCFCGSSNCSPSPS
jgi:hypothetical protein